MTKKASGPKTPQDGDGPQRPERAGLRSRLRKYVARVAKAVGLAKPAPPPVAPSAPASQAGGKAPYESARASREYLRNKLGL